MMIQDSDSVKAIKALEEVEKQLQGVKARAQRGALWAWQHDGVAYIDAFGFQLVTDRAGNAIEDAAPLFEVYLHNLGKVPPRFKAVFEQAAALLNWIGSLENQHGGEYILARALKRLQRVELGLQDLCTPPVKELAARPKIEKRPSAAAGQRTTIIDYMLLDSDDDKERLLKTLHTLIDGERGKGAALVMLVCIELGLMTKPSFSAMFAEFPGMGSRQGFNKYIHNGYSAYRQQEIDGARAHFAEYQSRI